MSNFSEIATSFKSDAEKLKNIKEQTEVKIYQKEKLEQNLKDIDIQIEVRRQELKYENTNRLNIKERLEDLLKKINIVDDCLKKGSKILLIRGEIEEALNKKFESLINFQKLTFTTLNHWNVNLTKSHQDFLISEETFKEKIVRDDIEASTKINQVQQKLEDIEKHFKSENELSERLEIENKQLKENYEHEFVKLNADRQKYNQKVEALTKSYFDQEEEAQKILDGIKAKGQADTDYFNHLTEVFTKNLTDNQEKLKAQKSIVENQKIKCTELQQRLDEQLNEMKKVKDCENNKIIELQNAIDKQNAENELLATMLTKKSETIKELEIALKNKIMFNENQQSIQRDIMDKITKEKEICRKFCIEIPQFDLFKKEYEQLCEEEKHLLEENTKIQAEQQKTVYDLYADLQKRKHIAQGAIEEMNPLLEEKSTVMNKLIQRLEELQLLIEADQLKVCTLNKELSKVGQEEEELEKSLTSLKKEEQLYISAQQEKRLKIFKRIEAEKTLCNQYESRIENVKKEISELNCKIEDENQQIQMIGKEIYEIDMNIVKKKNEYLQLKDKCEKFEKICNYQKELKDMENQLAALEIQKSDYIKKRKEAESMRKEAEKLTEDALTLELNIFTQAKSNKEVIDSLVTIRKAGDLSKPSAVPKRQKLTDPKDLYDYHSESSDIEVIGVFPRKPQNNDEAWEAFKQEPQG